MTALRLQPYVQGYLGEGRVDEGLEVLGDGLGRGRSHLLDDLSGVVVQKLVHCFT